jgi:hypothetical protein
VPGSTSTFGEFHPDEFSRGQRVDTADNVVFGTWSISELYRYDLVTLSAVLGGPSVPPYTGGESLDAGEIAFLAHPSGGAGDGSEGVFLEQSGAFTKLAGSTTPIPGSAGDLPPRRLRSREALRVVPQWPRRGAGRRRRRRGCDIDLGEIRRDLRHRAQASRRGI